MAAWLLCQVAASGEAAVISSSSAWPAVIGRADSDVAGLNKVPSADAPVEEIRVSRACTQACVCVRVFIRELSPSHNGTAFPLILLPFACRASCSSWEPSPEMAGPSPQSPHSGKR